MVRLLGQSGAPVVLAIFAYRLITATVLIRTYFDPDEFWQSAEIAHRFVFGYGYETWDWKPFARIRGFAYPGLFALLFKLAASLGFDTPFVTRVGPRILQATIATIGDVYLYRLAAKWFNTRAAEYAVLCQLLNWFFLTYIVRALSNSVETVLTIIALYLWPDPDRPSQGRFAALLFAGLTVVVRPASAMFWLILCLHLFMRTPDRLQLVVKVALPIASSLLSLSLVIDYIYYQTWTFTMWNFVKFNLGSSRCSGAAMYGVHSPHWYVTQGLPAMLGTCLPFFLIGVYRSRRFFSLALIALIVMLMSSNPHKEFRFILPCLPLCFMYCGVTLADLRARYETGKPFGRLFISGGLALLVSNGIAAVYFARWHQSGPVALMDYLNEHVESISSVHFLTSCHSTPFYSYIHRRVPMTILECEPRFQGNECVGDRSTSDSEVFLAHPTEFVAKYYASQSLPSHIVVFDDYYTRLGAFFNRTGFVIEREFFHCHFGDSRSLLLLKHGRTDTTHSEKTSSHIFAHL